MGRLSSIDSLFAAGTAFVCRRLTELLVAIRNGDHAQVQKLLGTAPVKLWNACVGQKHDDESAIAAHGMLARSSNLANRTVLLSAPLRTDGAAAHAALRLDLFFDFFGSADLIYQKVQGGDRSDLSQHRAMIMRRSPRSFVGGAIDVRSSIDRRGECL